LVEAELAGAPSNEQKNGKAERRKFLFTSDEGLVKK
jgi:hypothetical protein